MIMRIPRASMELQGVIARNQFLYDMAHWFAEILPPGVLATGDPEALYREYLRRASALEKSAGVTELELLVLVLTAITCIGNDFDRTYPAAGRVLRSTELDQDEKAAWLVHFMEGFPYLHDPRFAGPIPRQGPPPELLPEASP